MAATKILHKFYAGAIHSVDLVDNCLLFYKYSQPIKGSFKASVPFRVLPVKNIHIINIEKNVDMFEKEYLTDFHFKDNSHHMIHWPIEFKRVIENRKEEITNWQEDTEEQIRNLVAMVTSVYKI